MRRKIDQVSRRLLAAVSSSIFLKLTLAWFIIQALYIAVTVRYGLPPDENYHFSFIQLFAQHSPSPFLPDQGHYAVLTEVVHNPFFLYHYLLSLPYYFMRHWDHAYIVLRLFNVALGTASLWLVYKIAVQVKLSALARNLSIFMLANTLMFVFMPAGISYDNLFIFLSLASVLLLLRLFEQLSATRLLLMTAVLLAGLMTKINFLPMAFIILVLLVWKFGRRFGMVLDAFRKTFAGAKRLNIALSILVVLLGGLFVQRYATNLVKFHSFEPACQRVRPIDDCRKSALFVRTEQLTAEHRRAKSGPLGYYLTWQKLIVQRTYGVYAHERFTPDAYMVVWISVMAAVSLLALAKYWRPTDRAMAVLLGISLFSAAVLFAENYLNYRHYGIAQLAVHGRYLFGVLPLIYLVANQYSDRLWKNMTLKAAYVLITIIVFVVSSLPTYLHKATPAWHQKVEPPKISLALPSGPATKPK